MCHNNILNIFDYNVYDLDEYCIPLMLDHKQSYAVGHGQAVDHHGHVYNVRLYYSQQKSIHFVGHSLYYKSKFLNTIC